MGAKYTEAQKKASKAYAGRFEDIKVRVPEGTRDKYKALAAERGTSLNKLIIELLNREIDNKKSP